MSTSVLSVARLMARVNSHKVIEQQKKYGIADESDEEIKELYQRTTPLRLIVGKKKKQRLNDFPVSFFDTITFYRAFMVTIVKHCNIYIRFQYIDNFAYVMQRLFTRMFEGIIMTTYVQLFFGIYVPGEHLYISKIAPLFSGTDILYLMCSMVELTRFSDIVFVYAGFFFEGVLNKNPWDHCPSDMDSYHVVYRNRSIPMECVVVESFKQRVKNYSHAQYIKGKHSSCYYFEKAATCLTVPQIIFNFSYYNYIHSNKIVVDLCFMLIWTIVLLFCNTIFKKQIWRSLSWADLTLFSVHVLLLVYLKLILHEELVPVKKVRVQEIPQLSLWEQVQLIGSSYVQTPPVLHIITSRRPQKTTRPGFIACLIVLTNTLYSMIYFYVHEEINEYAANMMGVDINPVMNSFCINPVLHYMFIFFWKFSFGNILSLFYLGLTAIHEILILIITYQLVIELLITRYAWLPRVLAVAIVTIVGLALNVSLPVKYIVMTHAYIKGVLVLVEVVALYILYPINRLIDDLTFFFGEKPARIWQFLLITYPFFIVQRIIDNPWVFEDKVCFVRMEKVYYTLSFLIPLPILIGVIYMVTKLHMNKMKISQIFCPTMDWGPHSFTIRQLRKQFSYRDYVISSAPKVLTRYLLRNSEPEKYKVDVCYDGISTDQPALTVTEAFELKLHWQ